MPKEYLSCYRWSQEAKNIAEKDRVGPLRASKTCLGIPRGGVVGRNLAPSFDGWVHRCPSLARVPLSSRVLQPSYAKMIVRSTLIYR